MSYLPLWPLVSNSPARSYCVLGDSHPSVSHPLSSVSFFHLPHLFKAASQNEGVKDHLMSLYATVADATTEKAYPQTAWPARVRPSVSLWRACIQRPGWPAAGGSPVHRHAGGKDNTVYLQRSRPYVLSTMLLSACLPFHSLTFSLWQSLGGFLFEKKYLPFCRGQEQKSWIHRCGRREASRRTGQRAPAPSEPTRSPELLWSCSVPELPF